MKCPNCGSDIDDKAVVCIHCTRAIPANDTSRVLRMLAPVGRSGYAIAAGYLGLFAILLIPSPLALVFGILGYNDIKRNPLKHGMGRVWFGIIMGGFGTVMLIGLFLFRSIR